ncbi:MAG TPA: hypothetical protein VG759_21185 [Candidatus Angelobacter sp.]|jgi:hypothetical protein|nr:hypothetical protein [Candidatus Angelobacter sp.]
MKSVSTTVVIIMLFGLAVAAQNSANGSGSGGTATPAGSATTVPQGTTFLAELTKNLDAKKLKVSDEVTAKFSDDVIAGGKLLIRKGSKLFGHVTEVLPHSKENPESKLGIVFDKALLPDGRKIAFHGTIDSYIPPVKLTTPSVIRSGDDPMNRASGPYVDTATGKVYEHNPSPRQDPPLISPRTLGFPVPGSDGLYLNPESSVFLSKLHTVKLEGGAHVNIYVAK